MAKEQQVEEAMNESHMEARDSEVPPAFDETSFPDGGVKAWLTVLGGFLSFIATIGFLSGASVFQSYYMELFAPEYTPSDVAWIGSVQIWGCFFFGFWSGELSDKYGPKLPIAVGTCFVVFGVMMSSIASKFYQVLLSQGFCLSLGMGLTFTPALAVQSQWFLKRRGFVVGLVVSGQNVGGVIWPILVNRLLNFHGVSLGWTLRTIGFMQLALLIAGLILVQPRFPRGHVSSQPITLKNSLPAFFTDKRTVLYTVALTVLNMGVYVPWFFITPYAMQWGASASMAFYDNSILNAGAFFGCYALGIVADLGLGYFNVLVFATFSCGVIAFLGIGAHYHAGLIVWTAFYGLASGAVQAIFSPCISLLAPTPELIGSWNGICITIISFAVLSTGPVAGRLLDVTGGTKYLPMQVYTGVCLIVASVLLAADRLLVSHQARV